MFDYIENLRAKPKHQRRTVAFFASLAVTALIFTTWAFFTLSSFQTEANLVKKEREFSTDSLATLRAGFDKSFQVLVKELSVLKEGFNEGFFKSFLYQNSPSTESFYSSEEAEIVEKVEEETIEAEAMEEEEVKEKTEDE